MYIQIYGRTHACMHVCIVSMCVCLIDCQFVCLRLHACMHMYDCFYIRVSMYVYIWPRPETIVTPHAHPPGCPVRLSGSITKAPGFPGRF